MVWLCADSYFECMYHFDNCKLEFVRLDFAFPMSQFQCSGGDALYLRRHDVPKDEEAAVIDGLLAAPVSQQLPRMLAKQKGRSRIGSPLDRCEKSSDVAEAGDIPAVPFVCLKYVSCTSMSLLFTNASACRSHFLLVYVCACGCVGFCLCV